MIELSTKARVNADNFNWVDVKFVFDEDEPFLIMMLIDYDTEVVEWEIGRMEMRDAAMGDWPSGVGDIVMIRFEGTFRMYLKNETEQCSLDFKMKDIKPFLIESYNAVSHWKEQAMIEEEIDKWTSN